MVYVLMGLLGCQWKDHPVYPWADRHVQFGAFYYLMLSYYLIIHGGFKTHGGIHGGFKISG